MRANLERKVIFTTTLDAIRKCHPCHAGWVKLLRHLGKKEADDEPVNLLTILGSNGVQDMLWALQCVEHPEIERIARLMAGDFAEAALSIFEQEYPDDKRPRNAITVARRYATGKATDKERIAASDAAADAAWDAAADAAADAARAAAWAATGAAAGDVAAAAAADAAADAARAAARGDVEDAQGKVIRKYLT